MTRLRADIALARRGLRYQWAAQLLTAGATVLDVACGPGDGIAVLDAAGLAVTGIDRAAMIDIARGRLPAHQPLHAGSVIQLPFDSGSFGAVVCFDGLPPVDMKQALVEMVRVLHAGGLLIVDIATGFESTDTADVLEGAGLHVRTVRDATTVVVSLGGPVQAADSLDGSITQPSAGHGSLILASRGPLDSLELPAVASPAGQSLAAVLDQVEAELIELREGRDGAVRSREETARLGQLLLDAEQAAASVPDLVESHRITRGELVDAAVRTHKAEEAAAARHVQVEELIGRFHEVQQAYANAMELVRTLKTSRSWRVTGPMRWLRTRTEPRRDER